MCHGEPNVLKTVEVLTLEKYLLELDFVGEN